MTRKIRLNKWLKKRPAFSYSLSFLTAPEKAISPVTKIACGLEHSPLTETNCSELKYVVDLEAELRHSFIHPTPRVDDKHPVPREFAFLSLEADRIGGLCDAAVDLIRKISDVIGPEFGDTDLWLFSRENDGRFPAQAFN